MIETDALSPPAIPRASGALPAAALSGELLALALILTASMTVEHAHWWLRVLYGSARIVPLIGLTAAIVAFLLSDRRRRDINERSLPPSKLSSRSWAILHAVCVALLAALTACIANPSIRVDKHPVTWFLAWSMSLVVAVLSGGMWLDRTRTRAIVTSDWGRVATLGSLVGVLSLLGIWAADLSWKPLGRLTLAGSAFVLRFFDPLARTDADIFTLSSGRFTVEVGYPCSGYEGIGLACLFVGLYLWIRRDELRFPRAFLMLPLAIAAAWGANVLRISALMLIGERVSPAIALDGFHSNAGWLCFNFVCLGIAASLRGLTWFEAKDGVPAAEAEAAPNEAVPYLAPLLALIGTALATNAFTSGFNHLYPIRIPVVLAVFLAVGSRRIVRLTAPSVSSVVIGFAVYAIWILLERQGPAPRVSAPDLGGLSGSALRLWIVARIAGSIILVPVVEELAFRGWLARRLCSSDFASVDPRKLSAFSFIASSALFGLLHQRWLAGFAAGLAYALAYRMRGRVGDAILAHAITNALIAAEVLVLGHWSLWS